MTELIFSHPTLDDLMHSVIEAIQQKGVQNSASRGGNVELLGVLLELSNPRARLSRTETRGKIFSCLGELCWYLAGTNELEFIAYYINRYRKEAENGKVYGGYGPRLISRDINQIENVTSLLRLRPPTRRAVIQLFDALDLVGSHIEIPCTCTVQFLLRDGRLNVFVNMRSNDVIKGLPHDIFCFTMIQEMVARELGVDIGWYRHAVGSLHLYDEDVDEAKEFLGEGYQPTDAQMPSMPVGSPKPSIAALLEAEAQIRETGNLSDAKLPAVDAYWKDLIRLLQAFRAWKDSRPDQMAEIRRGFESEGYVTFVERLSNRVRESPRL